MATIVKPTSQELFPTPYEHVNYTFNTVDTIEEYRTARYLNRIINMFGQDCVIKGLEVTSIEIIDNNLIANINKGTLIQDSTLINVLNNFDKSINSLSIDTQTNSDYIVILYTSFQFQSPVTIPTSNPNNFSIKIGILNSITRNVHNGDPNATIPAPIISWNTNLYRTIIYAAYITNLDALLSEININSYVYNIRSNRVGSSVFPDINSLPVFTPDGGEIL